MIAGQVSGAMFRPPESRMSKSGKPFVSATIRIKDGADTSQYVRVVAFSDTVQAELLRLQDGDALTVQGPLTASTYTGADGNAKVSLSIVATHVLAIRQPAKERTVRSANPTAPDTRPSGSGDFSDDIPFGGDT